MIEYGWPAPQQFPSCEAGPGASESILSFTACSAGKPQKHEVWDLCLVLEDTLRIAFTTSSYKHLNIMDL